MDLPNNVISLDCTLKSHVYIVPTSNGYTLIDASFPLLGKKILDEIKKLGIDYKKINKILITHSDIDHIGSLKFLEKKIKCPVYISKREYENFMVKSRESMKKMFSKTKARMINTFFGFPKNKLKIIDSNHIDEFEVIETPFGFHSFGMNMFKFKNMLFAGDFIQSKSGKFIPIPPEYNLSGKVYIDFLKNFDMSKIEYVCQSHGKPLPAHPAWEEFIKTI